VLPDTAEGVINSLADRFKPVLIRLQPHSIWMFYWVLIDTEDLGM